MEYKQGIFIYCLNAIDCSPDFHGQCPLKVFSVQYMMHVVLGYGFMKLVEIFEQCPLSTTLSNLTIEQLRYLAIHLSMNSKFS